MRVIGRRISPILLCLVLLSATVSTAFQPQAASAAQILDRSVTLEAGAGGDGGSKAGGVVNHRFNFTVPTAGSVGSILFEYCTIASGTCTLPAGVVTTAASLGNESGATGFNIVNTTNGAPHLTRTASAVAANTPLSFRLDNVTNPTTVNQAFYIRISTFTSIDTTGTPLDTGTVAATTAAQIELTGTMPESLIFCTGGTVALSGSVPDCSTATSGAITFDQLFSPSDTATTTSQMAASTNATVGYSITVNGPTMTSGTNTIPALTTPTASTTGTGQFGMNLKANTIASSTTPVGAEVAPLPNGTDLRGQATLDYGSVDMFKFVTGDSIAASNNGGAGPTNAQIYTTSYIVNVPGNQMAGTYTTTLTYVCTATF